MPFGRRHPRSDGRRSGDGGQAAAASDREAAFDALEAFFDVSVPHAFRNAGQSFCEHLLVIDPTSSARRRRVEATSPVP